MNIYELYFHDNFFRNKVDDFVIKHRTDPVGAFKCMEIKEAYRKRLNSLTKMKSQNRIEFS